MTACECNNNDDNEVVGGWGSSRWGGGNLLSAAISPRVYRNPFELRSQAWSSVLSTREGDHLGIGRACRPFLLLPGEHWRPRAVRRYEKEDGLGELVVRPMRVCRFAVSEHAVSSPVRSSFAARAVSTSTAPVGERKTLVLIRRKPDRHSSEYRFWRLQLRRSRTQTEVHAEVAGNPSLEPLAQTL